MSPRTKERTKKGRMLVIVVVIVVVSAPPLAYAYHLTHVCVASPTGSRRVGE